MYQLSIYFQSRNSYSQIDRTYLTQDVPLMVQEEIELQVYSLIEIYFANIKCKKL